MLLSTLAGQFPPIRELQSVCWTLAQEYCWKESIWMKIPFESPYSPGNVICWRGKEEGGRHLSIEGRQRRTMALSAKEHLQLAPCCSTLAKHANRLSRASLPQQAVPCLSTTDTTQETAPKPPSVQFSMPSISSLSCNRTLRTLLIPLPSCLETTP